MFSKISIAAVAAIGLVAAAPTFAADRSGDPAAMAAKDPAPTDAKTRYCVRAEPVTGSIRQGRICKTANQWREEGVDVGKLQWRN